jgi:hypothetical protein
MVLPFIILTVVVPEIFKLKIIHNLCWFSEIKATSVITENFLRATCTHIDGFPIAAVNFMRQSAKKPSTPVPFGNLFMWLLSAFGFLKPK